MLSAKLKPHFGYLHEILVGRPRLVCDFLELYRYLMDDFLLSYARNLNPRDFVLKSEDFSTKRKGKREYLNYVKTRDLARRLNQYFQSKVNVSGIRMGSQQEIETLITEEAFLYATRLRNERETWVPRMSWLPVRASE